MYEVSSCGTTLELTRSHVSAVDCFNNAVGPVVALYKYDSKGNKTVVSTKYNHASRVNSFRNPVFSS